MNGRRAAKFICCFMALAGLFSLYVFICSLKLDWREDDFEVFEVIARIIGSALIILLYTFSAISAYHYQKRGEPGAALKISACAAFASVLLLCTHDVLLFEEYGNQLEGTFTMAAFFVLDAGVLLLYPAAYLLNRKRPQHPMLRYVLLAIALFWLVYIVGDSAGYPVSALTDWEEALMKFALMCNALMLLFFIQVKPRKTID